MLTAIFEVYFPEEGSQQTSHQYAHVNIRYGDDEPEVLRVIKSTDGLIGAEQLNATVAAVMKDLKSYNHSDKSFSYAVSLYYSHKPVLVNTPSLWHRSATLWVEKADNGQVTIQVGTIFKRDGSRDYLGYKPSQPSAAPVSVHSVIIDGVKVPLRAKHPQQLSRYKAEGDSSDDESDDECFVVSPLKRGGMYRTHEDLTAIGNETESALAAVTAQPVFDWDFSGSGSDGEGPAVNLLEPSRPVSEPAQPVPVWKFSIDEVVIPSVFKDEVDNELAVLTNASADSFESSQAGRCRDGMYTLAAQTSPAPRLFVGRGSDDSALPPSPSSVVSSRAPSQASFFGGRNTEPGHTPSFDIIAEDDGTSCEV